MKKLKNIFSLKFFIPFLFFIIFLIIGIRIYRDFGLHWDSLSQYELGKINFEYLIKGSAELKSYPYRYYGPIFEIVLYSVTKMLPMREMFFTQHLLSFLYFLSGIVCFYFYLLRIFDDWQIALSGCIFLALSPRIFAESFYNTKDIPFMVAFIFAITSLTSLGHKFNFKNILFHSLSSAIMISIRLNGVLILLISAIAFICISYAASQNLSKTKLLSYFILYVVFTVGLTVIFFPTFQSNPFAELINGLKNLSHFPWSGGMVLFRGEMIDAAKLPWYYIPTWVVITTPIIISIFFTIGGINLVVTFIKNPKEFVGKMPEFLVIILWLFLPIVAVIILKSVLYDGWRHLYFIYPAFIIIALYGLKIFGNTVLGKLTPPNRNTLLLFVAMLGMSFPMIFMIENHPYEYVYFNAFAGRNYQEIKKRYEMDYWGLSYFQALDYLSHSDKSPNIKVYVDNTPGRLNAIMLPANQMQRFTFVESFDVADYFLTNYRWHPADFDYPTLFNIDVQGESINTIYKLN